MSLFFQVLYDNTRFVEKEEEERKKKMMMMMMMMTGGKNANRINDGTMVKTLLSVPISTRYIHSPHQSLLCAPSYYFLLFSRVWNKI